MTDWQDNETIKKMLREMAAKELDTVVRELPQKLGNNIFRMPPAMRGLMRDYYAKNGGSHDTYYRVNVGYGYLGMSVEFRFSQDSITMVFLAPDNSRLCILELVELCLTRNGGSSTIVAERNTPESRSSPSISLKSGGKGSVYDDEGLAPKTEPLVVQRVPWSQIAQEFVELWGRHDPSNPQPEHAEVVGINGSGKSLWMCKAVQERMLARKTAVIIFQSKPADETILQLGWPIITNGDVKRALKERWCIYWPLTSATGNARKQYQADAFRRLLDILWRANANTIVVFDDVGYIQSLYDSNGEPLNPIIEMYLREGRSAGITCVLVKQRPQGAKREMHSETYWTIAFAPKDEDDKERFAQLFGNKKLFMPVFDQMDSEKHEFLIKYHRSGLAVISWIDTPLRPLMRPKRDAKSYS